MKSKGHVILSFGYDTERPYGEWAKTGEGKDFRKKQINFIQKLTNLLDKENVPRTFFILGNYLDLCLEEFSKEELRKIYNKDNFLNDLQQHSYSHQVFRKIEGREDKKVLTVEEYGYDLKKATEVLFEVLGVIPNGLRIPLGHCGDLTDMPNILLELDKLKLNYVSSDLKGINSFDGPLTLERQPHNYGHVGFKNIVEIPSQGWQDVFFTEQMNEKRPGNCPNTFKQILNHYISLLDKAKEISNKSKKDIYISLCLHPQSVMEYDPDLEIHKNLIDYARKNYVTILSYNDVAKRINN